MSDPSLPIHGRGASDNLESLESIHYERDPDLPPEEEVAPATVVVSRHHPHHHRHQ